MDVDEQKDTQQLAKQVGSPLKAQSAIQPDSSSLREDHLREDNSKENQSSAVQSSALQSGALQSSAVQSRAPSENQAKSPGEVLEQSMGTAIKETPVQKSSIRPLNTEEIERAKRAEHLKGVLDSFEQRLMTLTESKDVSNFMQVFRKQCKDTFECHQVYQRLKTHLKAHPEHIEGFTNNSYTVVMGWIKDNQSVAKLANTAQVRYVHKERYTRKTAKGEEEVKVVDQETYVPEFVVPEFDKWKTPDNSEIESVVLSEAEEPQLQAPSNTDLETWHGHIHTAFSSFKGYAYQVFGVTHNVFEAIFTPHLEFQKGISVTEMDQYLREIRKSKTSVMTVAFWLFPEKEDDVNFTKAFNYHLKCVGIAQSLKRPWVKDMFLVSVRANHFPPSVLSVKRDGQVYDLTITPQKDFGRNRMLLICTMYVYHPIVMLKTEYDLRVQQIQAHKSK